MGLRGPHAHPLTRPQPAPKLHVIYKLTCWECRKSFQAKRIDAQFCGSGCRQWVFRRRQLNRQIEWSV
jgi:hypothetical protein